MKRYETIEVQWDFAHCLPGALPMLYYLEPLLFTAMLIAFVVIATLVIWWLDSTLEK